MPLHRLPLFWLLLASSLTALLLWESGSFAPSRDTDTISYEHPVLPTHRAQDADLQGEDLRLALASTRTLLYPIVLELVATLSPDYSLLPRIHWFLFTLAAIYFWYATAVFSGSRWFALAVALPLAYPCWLIPYVRWVTPEAVAATLALGAVASLLLLARRPHSRFAWIALTLTTLLAYHAKPVLQLLVVMIPVLAPILRLSVEPRPRSLGRWCLGVVAATVLPLLLFCTLRWAVVGHFGLVAFNGYNLAGITTNLLDEELVTSLPEEHRPLGALIAVQRWSHGREPYSENPSLERWRRYYVADQWGVAHQAARHIVAAEISSGRNPEIALEPFNLVINRKLSALSVFVLRQKPRPYLRWVTSGFGYGLARSLDCRPVLWLLVGLLASLPLSWLVRTVRRRRGIPRGSPGVAATGVRFGPALGGIALLAASFYLGSLALIVLVSWPLERYLAVARLLLPSALGGAIFALWAPALRGLGGAAGRITPRSSPALARLEAAALVLVMLGMAGWWLEDRLFPAARADWISAAPASRPSERPTTFFAARTLTLEAQPGRARLLIQADEEYRVFVNSVLVGSDRRDRDNRLDTYEVGDLLKPRRNRLSVEVRSTGGEGALLCRLDVWRVGRKTRTVVSDSDWRIFRRFRPRILRLNETFHGSTAPVVVSSRRRWSLRAGPVRPRIDQILSTPAAILPQRSTTGADGAQAELDGEAGGIRTTFDWGKEVTGYLNLKFEGETAPAVLVYTGLEPPDPRVDRAQALARSYSHAEGWAETHPRRLRYATVVSTSHVAGAWIDAVKPEWAEQWIAEGESPRTDTPSSPSLEELWREIAGSEP